MSGRKARRQGGQKVGPTPQEEHQKRLIAQAKAVKRKFIEELMEPETRMIVAYTNRGLKWFGFPTDADLVMFIVQDVYGWRGDNPVFQRILSMLNQKNAPQQPLPKSDVQEILEELEQAEGEGGDDLGEDLYDAEDGSGEPLEEDGEEVDPEDGEGAEDASEEAGDAENVIPFTERKMTREEKMAMLATLQKELEGESEPEEKMPLPKPVEEKTKLPPVQPPKKETNPKKPLTKKKK